MPLSREALTPKYGRIETVTVTQNWTNADTTAILIPLPQHERGWY